MKNPILGYIFSRERINFKSENWGMWKRVEKFIQKQKLIDLKEKTLENKNKARVYKKECNYELVTKLRAAVRNLRLNDNKIVRITSISMQFM